MVVAVVIFVSGYKSYNHIKPTGSPLERALDLSLHAFLRWLRNPCGRMAPAATPRPVDVRTLSHRRIANYFRTWA